MLQRARNTCSNYQNFVVKTKAETHQEQNNTRPKESLTQHEKILGRTAHTYKNNPQEETTLKNQ